MLDEWKKGKRGKEKSGIKSREIKIFFHEVFKKEMKKEEC
jgi:hypothetical protein